ncbi:MAG TPA: hypothetical protein VKS25_12375 [Solirubrobacteraceae bacterium]|nr:hypothetical protein [Solirubrobacteraceae bacterium]
MSDERDDDEPTDVLAAEEFGVPAPDPALQPEKLQLPTDLVGGEPRDVLVAEEFAMPAPDEARVKPSRLGTKKRKSKIAVIVTAPVVAGIWVGRRVRRRRKQS